MNKTMNQTPRSLDSRLETAGWGRFFLTRRGMPVSSREPWTVRVALWSAKHRFPVFAAWFLLIAGLMLGAAALGSQRSQSVMDKGQTIGEAQTGWNV